MKHHNGIRSYDHTAGALAFPLGGIGTGNVSLGARGQLRDWEIFNQPAKGNTLPLTFFALRCQQAGCAPRIRVLEGPLQAPHTPSHGYHPMLSLGGLPRFKGTTFRGQYPFASIEFHDEGMPLSVALEAYTPLLPLNPEDSGIPCAILTYTVRNTTADPVDMTIVGSLTNPVGNLRPDKFRNEAQVEFGTPVNDFRDDNDLRGLLLTNPELAEDDLHYGSLALASDHESVTYKRSWLRGEWWDYLHNFWDDLMDDGLLEDPDDDAPGTRIAAASLGLVDQLEAGESKRFRFLLTWHFPNRPAAWDLRALPGLGVDAGDVGIIRNHYATRFNDAWGAARYTLENLPRLELTTRKFHDALFESSLPPVVLDAVSANIVPARSTTCFWLEDGRFYGWEGCFDDSGCCAGTCTHVWSYAYTIAYLFPSLEREMRKIEFNVETADDGAMKFRSYGTFHANVIDAVRADAAVDGQMGSILRAYREWQLSRDDEFLAGIWDGVKRAIGFASAYWDTDNDHVLDAVQHNTYDIEFHGPNPLSSIYYLAAVRAVEEMARGMGETELSARCRDAFDTGSKNLDRMLWNDRYYIQKLDDADAQKYQHGEGCLSDQLLGQLHASLLGLGDLLPADHVKTALKSIHEHNFKRDFSEHANCQRVYALNDEAGLLLCTWPQGGRPRLPFPYADEVWTGIEYQVAAHLILEGWVDEGIEIVEALRARHDGVRRNPWNEVECGNHYARSMSSWALLLALSGMRINAENGGATFEPADNLLSAPAPFRAFWSDGREWGVYSQTWDAEGETWKANIETLGAAS